MAATGYTPIQLYYSTTASATPFAGNLLSGELAINITDGKLYYKDNAGAVQLLSTSTTANGTANGVLYLNGSKVATSGSALTFDGSKLGINTNAPATALHVVDANYPYLTVSNSSGTQIKNTFGANGITQVAYAGTVTNHPIGFLINDTETMRLTSTGLGIGTSSPGDKIHAAAGTAAGLSLQATGTGGSTWRILSTDNAASLGGGYLGFNNGSYRMVLDSSGNLGLGVTPSAWFSSIKAIDINAYGAIVSSGNSMELYGNAYFSSGGSFIYKTTAAASRFQLYNGGAQWFTAPSGTAGNAISFTQAMTLDASGNWLLGTTSAYGKVSAALTSPGSLGSVVNVASFGSSAVFSLGGVQNNNDGVYLGTGDAVSGGKVASGIGFLREGSGWNSALAFYTNNVTSGPNGVSAITERARIDSSGNLLVGTTSDGAGLGYATRIAVDGGASEASVFKTSAGTSAYCSRMWNSATSGNNLFINFQTEAGGTDRGSISYNRAGGLVAYNVTSDYRAKDISGPVENSGALIDSVPVYMGKMKGATQERPMFIAHETPAYAHTGEKDAVDADGNPVYQQMDASALIPVMWAEIQSLRARVAALES